MTHAQLIKRLRQLIDKQRAQARHADALASQEYDPNDPFSERRWPCDNAFQRGCSVSLGETARELELLLADLDPVESEAHHHCHAIRAYARRYDTTLESALLDYEGEGYFYAAPTLRDRVREVLGISTQAEDLHHY